VRAEPLVLERSASPAITSKPQVVEAEGEFRYAVQAASPVPGAKLRFELLEGPDGMTIDPATGVVRWRPASGQHGRFDVEVAVMDQWGSGVAQSFAIQSNSPEAPPASPR
jgi:Putative Ig domain